MVDDVLHRQVLKPALPQAVGAAVGAF